ncbi:MAG: N-acetylglucosamine-6-phosphate deacetylase [Lachnospiraceae bacterium]|nr:N-acetylglucosamine-6-phosphate deacetylase [Lachnospiraceae bacterium]
MASNRLTNVNVFLQDDKFHKANLVIEDGIFTEVSAYGYAMHTGRPQEYLIPGLVDIHMHGADGADLGDGTDDSLHKIAAYEARCGITSFCPTTMTVNKDQILQSMTTAGNFVRDKKDARVLGVTMEGPFVSPEKRGAQAAKNMMLPDGAFFDQCQDAAKGKIRQVVLAPELEGALDFIKAYHDKVIISLGHTAADYDTCCKALDNGANHVTHLFNAMSPFHHRDPGLVGAARDFDAYVEVICDGIHIHQSMIRAITDLFPLDRICLISDSMEATGLADGRYALGGQPVNVNGPLATLDDGTIAGSVTNLFQCMRRAMDYGFPMQDAIRCASLIPARSLHLDDKIGSIAEGKCADFVCVDDEFNIKYVVINGQKVQ